MSEYAISEAKRCLQCKNPSCKNGCPVSTPINDVIRLLLEGKIVDAGEILFNNNPLSIVCSLVCPHEKQCEGHCVLNKKGNPIKIGMIENYISDYYLNYVELLPGINNGNKIAIVGSGPAGLTIALSLALKGYEITIFEAHNKIGGVLRYGIPEFRLPKIILEKLYDKLIRMGIKIRPNTLIGPILTVDDLFRDGYKSVFIGTGVWNPNIMRIKGESLGHVHYAIDYLKNPESYRLGNRVCVIGAGNVAMDVARTVLRNGSRDVTVMYRKGEESIEADPIEVQIAKIEGVQFIFYKSPIEFVDEGVFYRSTHIVGYDDNKKEIVEELELSTETFICDSIILAIGQKPRRNIVNNSKGIDVDEKGLLITNEYGRTTRQGVFASGDVVTGAKTVVEAVHVSKMVAEAIDEFIFMSDIDS